MTDAARIIHDTVAKEWGHCELSDEGEWCNQHQCLVDRDMTRCREFDAVLGVAEEAVRNVAKVLGEQVARVL